jgi:hypothetical protein
MIVKDNPVNPFILKILIQTEGGILILGGIS